MDPSARMAFNMKVLRRHDPLIVDIIESASFVVLYSHDGEWTKTGIEGPMFLYRRSASPAYGFFVLNRNGVENYSANLTKSDDLELTTEFIIYRATKDEDVVGIWIFEPSQRESVGKQMLKLQSMPSTGSLEDMNANSSTAAPPTLFSPLTTSSSQAGQSISLDDLFGTPANQSTAPPAPAPAPSAPQATNGLSLLDSIFNSAPSPSVVSAKPASISPLQGEEGLRAMLGLQSRQQPVPLPDTHPATQPSGLEALFSSTTLSNAQPQEEKADRASVVNGKSAQQIDSSAAGLVDAALQSRSDKGIGLAPSLSRRDFVREVLSLIHVSV